MKKYLTFALMLAINSSAFSMTHKAGLANVAKAKSDGLKAFEVSSQVWAIKFSGQLVKSEVSYMTNHRACDFIVVFDWSRFQKGVISRPSNYDQSRDYHHVTGGFFAVPSESNPFLRYIFYSPKVKRVRDEITLTLKTTAKGSGWRLGIPSQESERLKLMGFNRDSKYVERLIFKDSSIYDVECKNLSIEIL